MANGTTIFRFSGRAYPSWRGWCGRYALSPVAPTSRQGRYRDYVIYSVLRDEVKLEDSASEDGTV